MDLNAGLGLGFTAAGMVFGAGVAWGVMRSKAMTGSKTLREIRDTMAESHDKISEHVDHLEAQMTEFGRIVNEMRTSLIGLTGRDGWIGRIERLEHEGSTVDQRIADSRHRERSSLAAKWMEDLHPIEECMKDHEHRIRNLEGRGR